MNDFILNNKKFLAYYFGLWLLTATGLFFVLFRTTSWRVIFFRINVKKCYLCKLFWQNCVLCANNLNPATDSCLNYTENTL